MSNENETIEFKEMYTENIYKDIISFLNTNSGTIYVGYNDDGELVGLENLRKVEEKISNGIKTNIYPDSRMFISINSNCNKNKDYICIKISKGIDIYYLKEKGILKGTYIRTGSCSIPATEETVKQMLINNSSLSFESLISSKQNLTFNYVNKIFLDNQVNIIDNNIKENLHLMSHGKYTNLGLLFSDQNPFGFKLAVYQSYEKMNFLDRKEFHGSILEIYDNLIDYLKINTAIYGLIDSSERKDIEEYPEFVLREIILNSIVHRDYSSCVSNIINIYKEDKIELISYGSLYGNLTLEDILHGLSASRNPTLQSIFMRIRRVEAIGSGLRRVNSYYEKMGLNFNIKVLSSSFIVELPRITIKDIIINSYVEELILKYTEINGSITRKKAEEIISKEKTTTANILNRMVKENLLNKIGNGPNTKYIINKQ